MVDLMEEFEKIFQQVTEIVFKKRIVGLQDYEKWLMIGIPLPRPVKSPITGELVYVPPTPYFNAISKNLVNVSESLKLGGLKLSKTEVEELNLKNASTKLNNIKYLSPAAEVGENSNLVECCSYGDSHSCFRSSWLIKDKVIG